ncbi:MAG: EAL domain-containing protein [Nannocystis sp.]|nr:EAL domain-containing protein [Nannocystis sp.]
MRAEVDALCAAIQGRYGAVPALFVPALAAPLSLARRWSEAQTIDKGLLLGACLGHALLALLHVGGQRPYAVAWHLRALAEAATGDAERHFDAWAEALVEALGQPRSSVSAQLARLTLIPEDAPGRERLAISALLAASLAWSRDQHDEGLRRSLRALLGPARYCQWSELITIYGAWSEWLRSFSAEISLDAEPPLAAALERLVAANPALSRLLDAEAKTAAAAGEAARARPRKVDVDAVHTGILQVDLDGRVVLTNAESRRMFGLEIAELGEPADFRLAALAGLIFREDGGLCPVEEFPAMRCLATAVAQPPVTLGVHRRDGTTLWASYSARPLLDPQSGEFCGVTVTIVDISARKEAEAALQATEDRYRALIESSDSMIFLFDPDGRVLAANAAVGEYLRRPVSSLIGRTIHELVADRSLADAYFARNQKVLEGGEGILVEEMIELGAELRWLSTRLRPIVRADGEVYAVQAVVRDITQRRTAEIALREREEQSRHDALHDPLTRLPNRVLLMDRLAGEVIHARRHEGYLFAVLCLDLDRFKNINDSLGHGVGDQLLIDLSRRLYECLGPEDTLARTGGDEFVLLLKDLREPTDALKVADRVLALLSQPVTIHGHEIHTPTSIGVAFWSPSCERAEDILRDGDTAMFRAKSRGKNRYEIFDKAMHAEALQLLVLENDLRRAVVHGEFLLYYQPVVVLESGELAGFEALIRWVHPTRGLVLPGDFIAFAEETGIIVQIGEWVLREACRQMQRWQVLYPTEPRLTISVNLSGKQFAQPGLITRALRDTALDPASLKLEITESVIMEDPKAASELLRELQGQQIQSYVDDFGTGYSSLSYLQRFPTSAVKIDRSFVSNIGPQGENSAIVRTIVNLAHNLGMKVIAEGVETEEQRALLVSMGCEFGQGYLFSTPLDRESAEALIVRTHLRRRPSGRLEPELAETAVPPLGRD